MSLHSKSQVPQLAMTNVKHMHTYYVCHWHHQCHMHTALIKAWQIWHHLTEEVYLGQSSNHSAQGRMTCMTSDMCLQASCQQSMRSAGHTFNKAVMQRRAMHCHITRAGGAFHTLRPLRGRLRDWGFCPCCLLCKPLRPSHR